MSIEIERKFLVTDPAFLAGVKGEAYVQGYIYADDGRAIRLRIAGDIAFLTIKSGSLDPQGCSRLEYEYEVPKADAAEMLTKLCSTGLVMKTRYIVPFKGKKWDVDVFGGDNEGLVLAEIELSSNDEVVQLPSWIGVEVTGQDRFLNASLARHPYKAWK